MPTGQVPTASWFEARFQASRCTENLFGYFKKKKWKEFELLIKMNGTKEDGAGESLGSRMLWIFQFLGNEELLLKALGGVTKPVRKIGWDSKKKKGRAWLLSQMRQTGKHTEFVSPKTREKNQEISETVHKRALPCRNGNRLGFVYVVCKADGSLSVRAPQLAFPAGVILNMPPNAKVLAIPIRPFDHRSMCHRRTALTIAPLLA